MEHHQQHMHPHHQAPHHQHPMDMEPNHNVGNVHYGFYPPQEAPDASYSMQYPPQMHAYDAMQNAPQPPQQQMSDLHAMQFRTLSLMPNQHPYPQQQPVYANNTSSSPPNLPLQLSSVSPPPQSPTVYDPLSPPVSGSDTSAENIYISRNSSGTGSPSSSRASSLVHRNSLRYNPTPSPSSSSGRHRRGRSLDSDDEETKMRTVVQEIANNRKEATRKQRIEAEQRRRDELRDGYARLKDVLPVSNQKSSKVSLLERATNYIIQLDKQTRQMQTRLAALESEVSRLRSLNEKISLSVGSTPEATGPGQISVHPMDRPLSPPPEGSQSLPQQHSLIPVKGEPPHEESSGSASDGGFD